jgi:hypothetical protein
MSIVLRRLLIDGGLQGDVSVSPERELFDSCDLTDCTLVVNKGSGYVAQACRFTNVKLLLEPTPPIRPMFYQCLFLGGNAATLDKRFFDGCHFMDADSRDAAVSYGAKDSQ